MSYGSIIAIVGETSNQFKINNFKLLLVINSVHTMAVIFLLNPLNE